jgi:hypothetical protein
MSKAIEPVDITEEDVYEDWQYETSGVMANEFIEKEIMPLLHDFDFDNDDEYYIYGTATFGVLVEILPLLAQLGYDKEDIIEQVHQYYDFVDSRILH